MMRSFLRVVACLLVCLASHLATADYFSVVQLPYSFEIVRIDESTGHISALLSMKVEEPNLTFLAGSVKQQLLYITTGTYQPAFSQVLVVNVTTGEILKTVNITQNFTFPNAICFSEATQTLYVVDQKGTVAKVLDATPAVIVSQGGAHPGVVGNCVVSERYNVVLFASPVGCQGCPIMLNYVRLDNGVRGTPYENGYDYMWFASDNTGGSVYWNGGYQLLNVSLMANYTPMFEKLTGPSFGMGDGPISFNAAKNSIVGAGTKMLISFDLETQQISTLPTSISVFPQVWL